MGANRGAHLLFFAVAVAVLLSLGSCERKAEERRVGEEREAAPAAVVSVVVTREVVKVVTATVTAAVSLPAGSRSVTPLPPTPTETVIVLERGEAIPWSFLPGGAWDSETLKRWVEANRSKVNEILILLGVENPEKLSLVGVTTGELPKKVQMLAVKPNGQIVQGDWLPKGTKVWYLEFERPGGELVRLAVNPACANLVGVLPPGVTATVVFTPVSTSTPLPPTSPPGGPEPKPTRKPRNTATAAPPTEVPPTEVPPTEIPPTQVLRRQRYLQRRYLRLKFRRQRYLQRRYLRLKFRRQRRRRIVLRQCRRGSRRRRGIPQCRR